MCAGNLCQEIWLFPSKTCGSITIRAFCPPPASVSLTQPLFASFSDWIPFPILGPAWGSEIHMQLAFSEGQQHGHDIPQTRHLSKGPREGVSSPQQSSALKTGLLLFCTKAPLAH